LSDEGVEQLVADALGHARTDQRWALPVPAGAGELVRLRAAVSQRRRTSLLVAGTVFAIAGIGAGVSLLPSPVDRAVPFASGGGEPVPGISPEWRPVHGHDWLMTPAERAAFGSSHTEPSSKPATVSSPAPLTDYSERLEDDARAVLPAGSTMERQDAPNGRLGDAAVHAHLADGTPVEIARVHLQGPVTFDGAPEANVDSSRPGAPEHDITGTTSAYVAFAEVGYGWPEECFAKVCQPRREGARSVIVVNAAGEMTSWHTPISVPLQTVIDWAVAAAARDVS
jgi:hypothetical protein